MSLSNTPKLYTHAEMKRPAPAINHPVQAPPVNPYQTALYECGEALI